MFKNFRGPSKISSIACIFVFALSGYGIDQKCSDRHEICPDHLKQTTYAPSYQEMLAEKPKAVPIAVKAAVAAPVLAVKAVALDDDKDGIDNTLDKCPETPEGYKVDKEGCPKSVTLNINFPYDSSQLPVSSKKDIDTLTEFLNENLPSKITIIGHTDSLGNDAYNQRLSEDRAKALNDALVQNGIAKERITSLGKGSKKPIATNKTDAGRAKNRRIEVLIK